MKLLRIINYMNWTQCHIVSCSLSLRLYGILRSSTEAAAEPRSGGAKNVKKQDLGVICMHYKKEHASRSHLRGLLREVEVVLLVTRLLRCREEFRWNFGLSQERDYAEFVPV
eukprot:scaffold11206_cov89-Skeletonema_dohrnii-CCMP3373.AAC.2